MATKKFTVYLYKSIEPWDEHDPIKLLSYKAEDTDYAVFIGEAVVELDIPEISSADMVSAQIQAARNQIEKERIQSQNRVNLLLERISKLQAIGHDGGGV